LVSGRETGAGLRPTFARSAITARTRRPSSLAFGRT
jgi:hypothetical protein